MGAGSMVGQLGKDNTVVGFAFSNKDDCWSHSWLVDRYGILCALEGGLRVVELKRQLFARQQNIRVRLPHDSMKGAVQFMSRQCPDLSSNLGEMSDILFYS
jgi:hypothetical protein